ncbi:L,D-transpeptidase family protein [Allosphingosinicella indica]|uniref:Lipoprotein-anchoring transpeptidase ErfK/SrfK n=1 Tax=Allosphingosinicella indica TaxID=941907 RepID=A0A1X7FYW2_9SPHN|nr:L,D-transpeptidase family protein [Allosphingosinicella indica]SMF60729.1 Lipoprotein-anchoring transpeptidase ErfK/SrfK [Allosphingosinicella indica]
MTRRKVAFAYLAATALVATGAAYAQQSAAPSPGVEPAASWVPPGTQGSPIDGTIFHAQVLLDRAGFTPGVIDGRKGMSFEGAVKGFQESRGLKVTGELDGPTRAALMQDRAPSTLMLRIDESDARGPFFQIPKEPADQAKLERMGYRNLIEKIAEKFHTTPRAIVDLNGPGKTIGAGSVLRLPNVLPSGRNYAGVEPEVAQMLSDYNVSASQPKADRVVVDKSDGVLRAYDAEDKLIAQFPATMGSKHDPLPLGNWKIQGVSLNPDYQFNPEILRTAKASQGKHVLPPGPNNPVGVVWLDLNKPHYGIHGTPEPSTIGRAQSNGCVRLTNWDAARLALMVKPGTPAIFQA